MSINLGIITRVIGAVLFCIGMLMLLPTAVAFSYDVKNCIGLFQSAVIAILAGAALFFFTKGCKTDIGKREGYMIVSLSWISAGIFSALPYILSNVGISVVDGVFESISGMTTTGATIFEDIEAMPQGLLLWRSMTQWIGGMGIIVLTVAIFPLLGVGGVELFVAESPGPTSNKIHPRIKETAKRLWLLYVGLSALIIITLD